MAKTKADKNQSWQKPTQQGTALDENILG